MSETAQEGDRVIEDLGQWDWSLRVTPTGDVVARCPIEFDGVLTFSTEDRPVPSCARSQTRLTADEVVQQYVARADSEIPKVELLEDVVAALDDGHSVTEEESRESSSQSG